MQKTSVSNDSRVQSTVISLPLVIMIRYTHHTQGHSHTHSCCLSQEEIESQKQQHEARIVAIKAEEKQKMDKITKELDHKWTDALR